MAQAAHRPLLDRILAGTGNAYHRWVALSATDAGGAAIDRRQQIERVSPAHPGAEGE